MVRIVLQPPSEIANAPDVSSGKVLEAPLQDLLRCQLPEQSLPTEYIR